MRSGLGAQLAIAKESVYGTRVTPTRALPFTSEDLTETPEYHRSKGLRAGRMATAANLHRRVTKQAGGSINMELLTEGMGWIFDLLHGNAVTPSTPVGATNARKQVHEIGLVDPYGKSLSMQVGRPDVGNTTRAFDYLGCKITELGINCEKGGAVTVQATIDAREEKTDQTLVIAAFDSDAEPFVFPDVSLDLAGSPAGNAASVNWKIAIPQNTDRQLLGTSGLKKTPIANDLLDITAECVLEFETMADHNRFKNETLFALKTRFQGDIIEAALPYYCELNAPAVKQTSSGPVVEGPDIITQSCTFEILDNGTNVPLTAELQNTDTAVV